MHDERMDDPRRGSARHIKVEYHDPDNAFRLVKADFQRRLPLRNLNWNTSNRPFRSIVSLNVDLQSDAGLAPDGSAPNGGESVGANVKAGDEAVQPVPVSRSQRHQIPGLRQTPYLKIYFLICQSSEEYKLSARRQLREWIKAIAAKHKSGKTPDAGEHDAFEWLIVHVVTPQTIGGTEWPSKSSNSILEKLKADFNGSSKGAVDRVCQVSSTQSFTSGQLVPLPVSLGKDTFLLHLNQAWEDVLHKMKGLVHAAFESRVQQYESDIKARLAQKSLPGWNFCLYFLLKEGLARGFEDMGLREDALITYGQLNDEIDDVIGNDSLTSGDVSATSFRPFSPLIESLVRRTVSEADFAFSHNGSANVRERILANDVSKLELATYVFARQCELRLSWSETFSETQIGAVENHETMQQLTSIYMQTLDMIVAKTFLVISELSCALESLPVEPKDEFADEQTSSSDLLQTWIFMIADQSLQICPDLANRQLDARGLSSTQIVDELARLRRLHHAARAKLCLAARGALSALAASRGWKSGLPLLQEMLERGLSHDFKQSHIAPTEAKVLGSLETGSGKLRAALESQTTFSNFLTQWSETVLDLLNVAEEPSTRDKIQMDLVAANIQSGNISVATNILRDLSPMYLRNGWDELALLCYKVYARCLEISEQLNNLISVLLTLCTIPMDGSETLPAETSASFFLKAVEASKNLKVDTVISGVSVLKITDIASTISHRAEDDCLCLKIGVLNSLDRVVRIDSFELRLVPVTAGDVQTVLFGLSNPTNLAPGSNSLEVNSATLCFGSYKVLDVLLRFEKLVFKINLHLTPDEVPIKGWQFVPVGKPAILLWPKSDSVDVQAYVARHVQLDLPMSVILEIQIGDKDIRSADVVVKPGSAGLRLHIENATRIRPDGVEEQLTGMTVGSCLAHSRHRVRVPYSQEGNLAVVALRVLLEYQHENVRYSLHRRLELPSTLPIAVNVQDTHRAGITFSKFAISSAIPSPLYIKDHDLTGLDGLECTRGIRSGPRMTIATITHPYIATYRTRRLREQVSTTETGGLLFKVQYGIVTEMLMETIMQSLNDSIQQSGHAGFSRLISSISRSILHAELSATGLDMIFHARYWQVEQFIRAVCDRLDDALPRPQAKPLVDWLLSWAKTNRKFVVPSDIPDELSRTLTVPMDIPLSKPLVEIRIDFKPEDLHTDGRLVGKPIASEIVCEVTKTIGHGPCLKDFNELRIEVEVYPDEFWLVAGPRRVVAAIDEGGTIKRPLQLVCLRSGCIAFPRIDAQLFGLDEKTDSLSKLEGLTFEICYLNSNQTILVT